MTERDTVTVQKCKSQKVRESQSDTVDAMERCISAIRCWMIKDRLKVNDSKTEFILIGTRQQLAKVDIKGFQGRW